MATICRPPFLLLLLLFGTVRSSAPNEPTPSTHPSEWTAGRQIIYMALWLLGSVAALAANVTAWVLVFLLLSVSSHQP